MRNDDLVYDWLDFAALQKDRKKNIIRENIIKIPNNFLIQVIELIALENDKITIKFDENKIIKGIIQTKLYVSNHLYETELRRKCKDNLIKLNQEIVGGNLSKNLDFVFLDFDLLAFVFLDLERDLFLPPFL